MMDPPPSCGIRYADKIKEESPFPKRDPTPSTAAFPCVLDSSSRGMYVLSLVVSNKTYLEDLMNTTLISPNSAANSAGVTPTDWAIGFSVSLKYKVEKNKTVATKATIGVADAAKRQPLAMIGDARKATKKMSRMPV